MRRPGLPLVVLLLVACPSFLSADQALDKNVRDNAKPNAAPSRTIRGRVVDPQGKPFVGVSLQFPVSKQKKPVLQYDDFEFIGRATTDVDGRFALEVAASDFPDERVPPRDSLPLLALHPGHGVEWFDVPEVGEVPAVEFVLSPEQQIRGRMIDAEGRPVAGATVTIRSVTAPPSGKSLDPYLEERKKQRPSGGRIEMRSLYPCVLPKSFAPTTDGDGQFVIHGIAAERVCEAKVAADHFATATLLIVNRQGLDPAPYNQPSRRMGGRVPDRLVGPELTHVGAPGLTIVGRATVDGGKPVASLMVGAAPIGTLLTFATTDADGRYRLAGLPRGQQIYVNFGPNGHDDLLEHRATVPATTDDAQKTVDVELKRGLLLSGRVLDPLTGNGVRGSIQYVPLPGNEYVDKPRYDFGPNTSTYGHADDEGKFRIAIIPGPGALLVEAPGASIDVGGNRISPFRRGHVSPEDATKLNVTDQPGGGRTIATAGGGRGIMMVNTVKYVNVAAESESPTVDVVLDRGKTIDVEIVDADGQPVTGATALGIVEPERAIRLRESRVTVYALDGRSSRKVIVLHGARGLAGSLTLTGEEPSPVRMTLGKSGSIRGRAVDESKVPIVGAEYEVFSVPTRQFLLFENAGRPQPTTDNEGRFRIANMVPGERFNVYIHLDGKLLSAKLTDEQRALKPGQELDLGEIIFAPPN